MHLRGDHVVELLVIDHADIDIRVELLACVAVVQDLAACVCEAVLLQGLAEVFLCLALECGGVDPPPIEGAYLAAEHLEHVPDGHT